MHNGGERVLERDGGEERFEGATVGDIASREGDGSACGFEVALQGLGAWGGGALS